MRIIPLTLEEANRFVARHHRHHDQVVGHKFSIGLAGRGFGADTILGVAIIGRPVSRHMDDGLTLEVTRCCTDGTRNACSMLYRSAWRAARAMGYVRLITYILDSETGSSVKGAGFKFVGGNRGGGSWSRESRTRVDAHPTQQKQLWELTT